MKTIFGFQMVFMLLFGVVAGAAISFTIDCKVQNAKSEAIAAVLVDMPMSSLRDIRI